VLLISLVITLVATPVVRDWAIARGVVDAPGGRRIHTMVTPRLGGVAIMLGFGLPIAAMLAWDSGMAKLVLAAPQDVKGLFLGALIVGGVGAIDDVRSVGAWPKLGAQAAAACVAYAFGYRIDAVSLPMIGVVNFGIASLPITIIWFLGVINALNLIDGLDGLAGGIAFFAATANGVIAHNSGAPIAALLSAALAGSLLGFLRYNFNPATIFMGDSGSMFIGFVLAATSLVGTSIKSATTVAILAPLVAIGVPVFDTALAIIRRTLAKQSMFAPDRGHMHHSLLDLGLSQRRAVLLLHASTATLCGAAIAISFGRSWQVGCALVVVFVVLTLLARTVRKGRLAASIPPPAADEPGTAPMLRYPASPPPKRSGH
jgi:UDP-GlcNAc:undecaprenyl-phosphate GlcNAc-1-phosphate transferase